MQLSLQDIRQVLIIGSGTLGSRIGLQCAISGFETTIYDIHEKAFTQARQTHAYILKDLLKREVVTEDQAQEIKSRIRWETDLAASTQEVDLVSESVTEDVALKKKVWEKVGALCPAHAVFTTNTSSLLPSQFAQESGRPEHFCAYHFHDVFKANVVDIMPHPGTAPWVVELLKKLAPRLNQIPVVLQKETPLYVFNAMLGVIFDTAGMLVAQGKTSIEDVDRSWMGNFKMPVGPFGMMDAVGLDTVWHVTVAQGDRKKKQFADFIKTYLDQGKMGVKTGEGFYKYPRPAYKEEGFLMGTL